MDVIESLVSYACPRCGVGMVARYSLDADLAKLGEKFVEEDRQMFIEGARQFAGSECTGNPEDHPLSESEAHARREA